MKEDACAIVVGISTYKSGVISQLPGARQDALRFAQMLLAYGFERPNLKLLLDGDATRDAIFHLVRVWLPKQVRNSGTKVIIFFAGHGSRLRNDVGLEQSILLAHDSDGRDKSATGIRLEELVSSLRRSRARELHLFVDACYQQFDVLHFPFESQAANTTSEAAENPFCFFALLAAGLNHAFEAKDTNRGIFTAALLRGISHLRNNVPRVSALAAFVQGDLALQEHARAVSYLLGTVDGWPLPLGSGEPDDLVDEASIPRPSMQIADALARDWTRPVWLLGKSGAMRMKATECFRSERSAIYVRFLPKEVESLSDALERLLRECIESALWTTSDARRPAGEAGDLILAAVRTGQFTIMVLENLENVPTAVIDSLVAWLPALRIDLILVSSRLPAQLSGFSIVNVAAIQPQDDRLLTDDSPSRVERAGGGLRDCILALSASEGYVDGSLFCQVFELEVSLLREVSTIGAVAYIEDRYELHEDFRLSQSEEFELPLRRKASEYWARQVSSGCESVWACSRLLYCVAQSGFEEKLERAVHRAVRVLADKNYWIPIEASLTKLTAPGTDLSCALHIAVEAVRTCRHPIVNCVLEAAADRSLDQSQFVAATLVRSEQAFWIGDFDVCLTLCQAALSQARTSLERATAYLNAGIAHFFLGQWDAASLDMQKARRERGDRRIKAWAHMISGTISALRGVRVEEGLEELGRASVSLERIGDEIGLAIALNNAAEARWKLGNLRRADGMLQRAHALAKSRGDMATELEVVRNQLHVAIRLAGPYSDTAIRAGSRVIELLAHVSDNTERMQALNTLATWAIYRCAIEEAEQYLVAAAPLTRGNAEYDIYTLANEGLLALLQENPGDAMIRLRDAVSLSIDGDNILAIKQLLGDLSRVSADGGFRETLAVIWHELPGDVVERLQQLEIIYAAD